MLAQQENSIVTQPGWASEMSSPKDGTHVYMMEQLDLNSCSGLEEMVKSSEHAKRGRLVNCLIDDIGRSNRVTLIWQFDQLDDCRGITHDSELINACHSIVMLPAPWSPMK